MGELNRTHLVELLRHTLQGQIYSVWTLDAAVSETLTSTGYFDDSLPMSFLTIDAASGVAFENLGAVTVPGTATVVATIFDGMYKLLSVAINVYYDPGQKSAEVIAIY